MYSHSYNNHKYPGTGTGNFQSTNHQDDKKFKYILSIGKKHIAFFLLMMLTIFGLIFLLGIFTGYSIGKKSQIVKSTSVATETPNLDNYNNFDSGAVSQNISNSIDSIEFVSQKVTIDGFNKEATHDVKTLSQEVDASTSAQNHISQNKKNIKPTPISKTKIKSKPRKTRYANKPVPGVKYYYIQVIATENVNNAKRIYDQLKIRKYPVKVKKSNKGEKFLYAIRVGLYKNKKLALRHLRLIRKGGGYTKAFIKSYQITSKIPNKTPRSSDQNSSQSIISYPNTTTSGLSQVESDTVNALAPTKNISPFIENSGEASLPKTE